MGVELPPPVTAVSLPAEAQTTSSSATPPWIASWPIGMLFRERLQNVAQGTSTFHPRHNRCDERGRSEAGPRGW